MFGVRSTQTFVEIYNQPDLLNNLKNFDRRSLIVGLLQKHLHRLILSFKFQELMSNLQQTAHYTTYVKIQQALQFIRNWQVSSARQEQDFISTPWNVFGGNFFQRKLLMNPEPRYFFTPGSFILKSFSSLSIYNTASFFRISPFCMLIEGFVLNLIRVDRYYVCRSVLRLSIDQCSIKFDSIRADFGSFPALNRFGAILLIWTSMLL